MLITQIEYDHTSLSKSTKFPFHFLPLQILYHRGCIHIAGISEVQRKIIILAVEQLKDYNYTNDTFAVKKNMQHFEAEMQNRFGITENMDNKLYNIQIEFSQLTGSFVSNHFWHSSQNFTQLSNGNYLLKLKCGINRELAGWIFQWMNNAKVVKPLQLKKLVLEKISQTQKLYTSKQSLTSSNIFRAE
jgi:predicted DNA-binding transcriptional regulator YafY